MPTRESAPVGAPCWIDLSTTDVEAARSFYSALFGWTAEEPSAEFGGYFMFTRDGVPVGGGMGVMPDQPVPREWNVYLATDDVEKTVSAAAEAGAQVVVSPMPVADLGVMAVLVDPMGAATGLWQPQSFPGLSVLGEPGTPGWFELLTRDYDRAVAFYRDVLGWDMHVMSDTPEFRYSTHGKDEAALAGIMDAATFLEGDEAPHWNTYFMVADTDVSLAKATELGGRVLRPAEDTPYGRLGVLADPTGTRFQVMGPTAQKA